MKYILLLFILAVNSNYLVSQTNSYQVVFEYDKAGNQVVRKLKEITIPNTKSGDQKVEKKVVDLIGEREIMLYPNPTKGNLYVEIKNGEDNDTYQISIFTMNGVFLSEQNYIGNGIIPFDFNSYSTGIYILCVKTGEKQLQYKVIKQ